MDNCQQQHLKVEQMKKKKRNIFQKTTEDDIIS